MTQKLAPKLEHMLAHTPLLLVSVAVWRAGADHKALFRAIHAKSGQRKPPRAKPGTGKPRAKRCQQAVQQGGNSLGGQDRLRQGARHAQIRWRGDGGDGRGAMARRGIQRIEQRRTKAPGEWRAGLAQRITNRTQAKPGEVFHHPPRQAKRQAKRQGCDGLFF